MDTKQTCPKCGGEVVQAEALGGSGPMLVTKPRSAIALGILRGSPLAARICISCGYTELYAANPEALK
jgi:predicted nucleic-acid-binding Zn-ribbon protein